MQQVINIKGYRRKIFLNELNEKIQEGENDIKNGRVFKAREVFEELRKEYRY